MQPRHPPYPPGCADEASGLHDRSQEVLGDSRLPLGWRSSQGPIARYIMCSGAASDEAVPGGNRCVGLYQGQ